MIRKGTALLLSVALALGAAFAVNGRETPRDEAGLAQVTAEASRIIILDDERLKPLASYARYTLYGFSGRYSCNGASAIEWLCKAMFAPGTVWDDPVFLINNPEVADAAGISPKKKRRYSLNHLSPGLEKLEREAQNLSAVDAASLSAFDRELLRTVYNVQKILQLSDLFSFAIPNPDFAVYNPAFASYLATGKPAGHPLSYYELMGEKREISEAVKAASEKERDEWTGFDSAAVTLAQSMYRWATDSIDARLPIIPVEENGVLTWRDPAAFLRTPGRGKHDDPALNALVNAYRDYGKGAYATCASSLAEFNEEVRRRIEKKGIRVPVSLELSYNAVNPFFKAQIAYFLAIAAVAIGLLSSARVLPRIGLFLITAGFLVHSYGLVARVIIMSRPPVTTLYETFVFVAWISVALGLCLEAFQRKGFGQFIASFTGAVFLFFAGKFGADGDTMGALAPILNNNFWLATHIITISMGYAGCFGAGVLGHIYLIQKVFLKKTDNNCAPLARSIYAVLAFGLTFTVIGTVLGGLWADQAWGRFWGWDPKENGALLIILWCAIVFHAKAGQLIRETGTAFGAIIGLMLVMLAWLGVNLLGIGMHAYGFTNLGAKILFVVLGFETIFIAIVAMKIGTRRLIT